MTLQRADARFCTPKCRLRRHRGNKQREALRDTYREMEAAHRRPAFTLDADNPDGRDFDDYMAVADLGRETQGAVYAVAATRGIRPGGARRWHYADVKMVRLATRKLFDRLNPDAVGELPPLADYVWVADEWRKAAAGEDGTIFDAAQRTAAAGLSSNKPASAM